MRGLTRRSAQPVGAVDTLKLSVGMCEGAVNRPGPSKAMKLGALETKGYMDPSMVGPLDREGCRDGVPVGLLEAPGSSLGALVCLMLTEGATERLGRLGATEVARALDTLGALDTEGSSDGILVSLLEVLEVPLGALVGPPLSEGSADMFGASDF